MTREDIEAIDARASLHMRRGIGLLNAPDLESVAEALQCFEQALELRGSLPGNDLDEMRHALAACHLNRAHAIMRLGNRVPEAVHSYDEAIALLRTLPLDGADRYRRRLAIALQNRALALQADTPPANADAEASFREAAALLEDERATPLEDRRQLLATIWTNLARLLASDEASAQPAREAARRALTLIADTERTDIEAAEIGVAARHVVCRTLAGSLQGLTPGDAVGRDEMHEATDAVDEGLAVVRHWEQQGVEHLREAAYDLFRFGVRVYEAYQPQFLQEFVRDNLDPQQSSEAYVNSAGLRAEAEDALRRAQATKRITISWSFDGPPPRS